MVFNNNLQTACNMETVTALKTILSLKENTLNLAMEVIIFTKDHNTTRMKLGNNKHHHI